MDRDHGILRYLGKPETLIQFTKDRLGHDFRYSLNSQRLENAIGKQPRISFHEGLNQTIDWYQNNTAWINTKMSDLNSYWKTVYE